MDDGDEILGAKWFDHIIFRAREAALETIQDAIVAREHDNGRVFVLIPGFEVLRDFVAVHSGQANVEKDEIGDEVLLCRERAQGFYAIGVADGGDAFAAEAHFDDFAHCRRVVYNHYEIVHASFLSLCLPICALRERGQKSVGDAPTPPQRGWPPL